LLKYALFFIVFHLSGKSTIKIYEFVSKRKVPQEILFTNTKIIYPILGLFSIGNLLVFFNFFLPLENNYVYLILLVFNLPALIDLNIKFKFDLITLIKYLALPTILVISTFDTSFNYDAGYYHIYHQAWLRESNLILGFVNIFWPLGMSSIYEYLSAILWFDTSFVLLHFLNLIFIHFFYNFIFENIVNNVHSDLKVASIFLLIYSFLDNFGIGGGRNGFIYIQGVGKQDIAVGILFFFISIVLIKAIKDKHFSNVDIFFISLLILFLYEIKLSSVIIAVIYIMYLRGAYKNNDFKYILFPNIFVISIFLIWTLKSFLTTACLIFPVTVTCFESMNWYVLGSTESYEGITKFASYSYELSIPFMDWVRETGSFEYRRQVFLNFIFSFLILCFIKILFFRNKKFDISSRNALLLSLSFVILNFLYLLFYGPIPRYAVGVCLLVISLIGFFSKDTFKKIPILLTSTLVVASLFLVVRSSSYLSLLNNEEFRIFDPRTNNEVNNEIGFEPFKNGWVLARDSDQCWSNTKCLNAEVELEIIDGQIFKTVYKINVNNE
tara:strand:+ start:3842 stop:5500 length:1659 start_codon:yes stop_codon:yes gene_type:complete